MNPEGYVTDWMKFSKNGKPINKQKIVLNAAKSIGRDKGEMGRVSVFAAYEIQKKLFPKVKGFQSKYSGISAAIQRLKRKGLIENAPGYELGYYRIKRNS